MTSKKMSIIPSFFKNKESKQQQLWQWPSSCRYPKTLSFRASNNNAHQDIIKTVNSIFLDIDTPESLFTNSTSESPSFSTDHELSHDYNNNHNVASGEALETIIQGVRPSERLFFEPVETSSIMKSKEERNDETLPFKESVAIALESEDPYLDFKRSMQEMVDSHGLKDWEGLEELLGWYLKMNGKVNHGFIVGAFVDLLIGLDGSDNKNFSNCSKMSVHCSDETWYSSASSSFSSSSPRFPREGSGQITLECEDEPT